MSRLGFVTTIAVALVLLLWIVLIIVVARSIGDGTLLVFWSTINDGQAQILSSGIGALAILTSAVLVPFVFKDRIRDLDGAVEEMGVRLRGFETDASARLESLSSLFEEKLAAAERRTGEDADRIGEVLEEIRSAVILSVSEGHINDPKHAKVFVQHLYNDAVIALQRRVREKPYLRESTRADIAKLRTMSKQYLDKLRDSQIITDSEHAIITRVKEYAYRRTDFGVADIGEINRARSDFDRAFGESAVPNVDVAASIVSGNGSA